MLFKVESRGNGRSTHCGVLEFSADEGMVYMPYWVRPAAFLHFDQRGLPSPQHNLLPADESSRASVSLHLQMMENLLVEEGAVVTVSSATLPKGSYVKLQPHTSVCFQKFILLSQ